jgi:hypothetical protein
MFSKKGGGGIEKRPKGVRVRKEIKKPHRNGEEYFILE